MNIGQRIKESREAAGLTQEMLGNLCGTTKQTIFKYESGIVTNIPLDRLEKIASVLNVSAAYLMGWSDSEAANEDSGKPLSGTYLRLARGAQELGLDDEDVSNILAIYAKHKKRNE